MSERFSLIESSLMENKDGTRDLNKFLDDITKKIFDLKTQNPQIINAPEYRHLIFHLDNFFAKLSEYYTIINETKQLQYDLSNEGSSLNSDERESLKSEISNRDSQQEYLHKALMEDYINIVYYYKLLFCTNGSFSFPLETFFFNDKGGIKADYGGYDSKGRLYCNLDSMDSATKNNFREFIVKGYDKINEMDDDSKQVFEANLQLIRSEIQMQKEAKK